MRTRVLAPALVPALVPLLGIALAPAVPLAGSSTAPAPLAVAAPAPDDVVGGDRYFFCAAGQTIKIVGLVTGNAGLVLLGAIGGGIACGLGQ